MHAGRRTLGLFLTAVLVAAVFVFLTGPRAVQLVTPAPIESRDRTMRGAFHIHTTRSDGALGKSDVAAAAARAGLQFAVFTDHGTGVRQPDPPEYLHGVLCLDGVEVSTNHGHYIGIGLVGAPYPLGGDAAAVVEDVARLGGFGVAAHPVSARAELAWSDWTVRVDGVEWLNADSEWRDESRLRLGRALLDYLWRPAGALVSLLDRPVDALDRWDALTTVGPVVGLAGHDAHGGFGAETGGQRGRRLHIPSYEASFRTFSLYAILAAPPTHDPAVDAAALLEAFRGGSIFTAIDAIASPAGLDFSARLGDVTVSMGGVLPDGDGPARFTLRSSLPSGATMVLKREGTTVTQGSEGTLVHEDTRPGAYRVEIEVPGSPGQPPVPWVVTNPIYRPPFRSEPIVAAASSALTVLTRGPWRVETGPGSSGSAIAASDSIALDYRLDDGPRASQFAALVVDLKDVPADTDAIVFRGRADRPMRVSAQLRFAQDGDERWARSFYLDRVERDVRLPIAELRYAGPGETDATRGQPPVARATSLLFVVDLSNTDPGAQGVFTLREVALAK